jgi:hypothetical protein
LLATWWEWVGLGGGAAVGMGGFQFCGRLAPEFSQLSGFQGAGPEARSLGDAA